MKFLLVGLGGSGSKVVDRVCSIVSQNEAYRNKVQFVCMDTDENDGEKLKNLTSVRTSTDQQIEAYLDQTDGWETWFPNDPLLRTKSLRDGAGQIRATSRLALDSAVASNKMAPLKQAIDKLLEVDEEADTKIKVMVVCSLAGGTGSGIFLQIPDLIKKYLCTGKNQDVIIRGLFMMPDIFKDEVDDPVQKESVMANAYAAFRELNAVNKACAMPKDQKLGYTMAINEFNSERDQGDPRKIPYNLIFAIDKTNENRQRIINIDRFEEQAANIIMMQLFSPLVASQFSKEDNRYPNLIQTRGKNIYGTAGTGKLIYPYDDLTSYCATRSVIDSLDKKWMYFDQVYDTLYKNYEREKKQNPTAKKPDIQRTIIDNVDKELCSQEPSIFSFLRGELLFETGDTGGRINRVDTYYGKIFEYVRNLALTDPKLETDKFNSTIQSSQIKKLEKRDTARRTITLIEESLKSYKNTVDNFVNGSMAFRAANAILWMDYDAEAYKNEGFKYFTDQFQLNENGTYSLFNLIKADGKLISPIAVRYIIYKLLSMIRESLKEAENDIVTLDAEILEYQNAFDDKNTPLVEDAVSIARQYENEGLLKKIKHGAEFDGFIKKYIAAATEQNERISAYAERKMYIKVFKEVQSRLMILADEYTGLFKSLPAVKIKLNSEAKRYAEKNPDSELVRYIYGSPDEKEKIYNDVKIQYESSDSLNETINEQINQSLYVEAAKKIKAKNERISTFRKVGKKVGAADYLGRIFSDVVVDATKDDFIDRCGMDLDKDIGTLLYEKYNDSDDVSGDVRDELRKIANLASPLLSYTPNGKQQMYDADGKIGSLGRNYYTNTYWVMHSSVKDVFDANEDEPGAFFSVRGDETGRPDISASEDFTPYELVYYNAVYGLEVNDIDLLNEETGECYLAYDRRVSQLNKNGIPFGGNYDEDKVIITPHLDLRWHNVLPYISSAAEDKERYKKDRLLLYALAYDKIVPLNYGEDTYRYFFNIRKGSVIEYDGRPIRRDYAFQLREAAYHDRELVRGQEQTLNNEFGKDIAALPHVDKEKFVTGLKFVKNLAGLDQNHINICDFLYDYRNSAPDQPAEQYDAYLVTVTRIIKDISAEISEEKKKTIFAGIKEYWFENSELAKKDGSVEYMTVKSWIDEAWDE